MGTDDPEYEVKGAEAEFFQIELAEYFEGLQQRILDTIRRERLDVAE